ncbi:uncharacterized protein LOC121390629 [Gigantopelta aegis]|uniref:uncharacterized protein LOC121390629 n=1 Tax=Gigantopelta aegis TaxID=1735272 RepID=UPI001B887BC3|nr:uncharacterized protein LOC121390629 [Gigantopelta aegis]
MADESFSVTDVSFTSDDTKATGETSQTQSSDDFGQSTVPLTVVSLNQQADSFRQQQKAVPELPSAKFQYSVWHDLKFVEVRGDELKAPRVRKAPVEEEKVLYKVVDEENKAVHHSIMGKEKTQHKIKMENWESAKYVSLSYQELNDRYQQNNMYRILARLRLVEYLNLPHNSITDISQFSFPKCEFLNLNNNYIASFKSLPKLPCIKYLLLETNSVGSLDGLRRFRSSGLEELYLAANPITFVPGYRSRVFQILPRLLMLDGIPKLESDLIKEPDLEDNNKGCVVA